ncbi:hypothetical protein K1X76_08870 [bacterium]|nr:hypothetical protein [bacterium]
MNSVARLIRAYTVTFRILLRYLGLFFIAKWVSEERSSLLFDKAHRKTAQMIVRNILILKGLYIKIGQTLSIMTNFLPSSITDELEQLQDAVPPHPFDEVKERFLADFKKEPLELFKRFDDTPIASASLGQVHVAYLNDGTKLAVKFQYPNIDEIVRSDLKTLKRIFGLFNFIFSGYGISEIYQECSKMILEELNYEAEGRNLERIRDNFKGDERYYFPKVYWELSSQKILSVEFVEGVKVTDVTSLGEKGISPHDVAVSLIHFYCKQIFVDGVYHADPHPGNIIIKPHNGSYQIAMVDYGATAGISPTMKSGMTVFVEGLIKKDTKTLAIALKQMGFVSKGDHEETLDKIVEYFYSKIRGVKIQDFRNINIGDFQHLNDIIELKKMDISLKELTRTFHVPREWILLERTLILMMGLTAHLDPHLNPMDIVLPYVEELVLGKDQKVSDLIVQSTKELLISYINLPTEISKVLKKLNEGKLTIQTKVQKQHTERIYQGIHQLIYTLLLTSSVSMGYLMSKDGNAEWASHLKVVSTILATLLFVSLFKNRQ